MKILSLFDGISCGRVALERANIPVEEYHAFEIDKYAIQISEKNYPDIVHHGDVFKGNFEDFSGFDMLIGGSPCTYWSIVQSPDKRETTASGFGWELFFQYVRALREMNPEYFVYENNYSMANAIRKSITETFGFEPVMIDSALLSGQSRKRLYWVGERNAVGKYERCVISEPKDKGILLKDILENGLGVNDFCGKSRTIKAQYSNTSIANATRQDGLGGTMVAKPVRIGEINKGSQGQKLYSVRDKLVTLSANGGGQGAKTRLYQIDLPDGDYIIRKLSPVETERLQTLPDNYTAGISNTQRYKCIGNGWTVDVIVHLIKSALSGKTE